MTSNEPNTAGVATDRSWLVPLGCAIAGMVVTALVLYLPLGKWTVILGVGLLVFIWIYSREFTRRCFGLAWTALGAAVANNIVPATDIFGIWDDAAFGAQMEGSHWAGTWSFCGAAVAFMAIGHLNERLKRMGVASSNSPVPQTDGDNSPIAVGDQVIGGRDAAGRDVKRDEYHIEHWHEAAAAATPGVPRQLPSPPKDFTGRDDELSELSDKIGTVGANISGVEGMPGVGKTALALVLAERLESDYPDGQFYIDLRGADPNQQIPLTPAEVMRHVLTGLDPARQLPEDDAGLSALYQSELHGRRALLLMDNAADREQVEPLIPPSGCLLLVTSRQRFVLPGLTPLNLDTLKREPARDLLLTICPRIGEHADEITKLCGYLPLALRVAGSTLAERPAMAPETLVKRLEDERLEQLNEVGAVIAVSEALLSDERRQHFHALSVFPESFERLAAARVLELEQDKSDDELDALLACSLLQWDDEAKRYYIHDLVRLFADQRLSDTRRKALGLRHARVYCGALTIAHKLYRKHGVETYEGLALFDLEWANIQAGFAAVSASAPNDEHAAQLCSRYLNDGALCLQLRQSTNQRIAWLEAAVDAARVLKDVAMEANHLGNLGLVLRQRGDLDEAEKSHRKALSSHEKLGRLEEMAADYGNLGIISQKRGELNEAEKMHCKALAIDEKLERLEGNARHSGNLGIIFQERGDLDEAEKMYRKALAINEKLRRLDGMAGQFRNLGGVFRERGDLEEAESMLRKSLAIEEKLGRLEGMAADYGNLGIIFETRGDLDEARTHWTKARDLFAQIGMPHEVEEYQGWLDSLPDADG